jgi:hypothetical protein
MISKNHAGAPEGRTADRRAASRYPIREDVRYRIVHSRTGPASGTGKTLNISSGGVLFTCRDRLPVGVTVELAIDWPAKLEGTCRLRFVALGNVVRSENGRTAVRIKRYDFKTRAKGAEDPPPGFRAPQ